MNANEHGNETRIEVRFDYDHEGYEVRVFTGDYAARDAARFAGALDEVRHTRVDVVTVEVGAV